MKDIRTAHGVGTVDMVLDGMMTGLVRAISR